ncbi:GNAT family N-acetyltransferase [Variovorax sp. PCZ-1]|nr:GNAT family N-acetyltransferase [Variovorax sp. PCZ-1]
MTQAKQLLQATLDAPGEFWRGPGKTPEPEAGTNPQAYPESDVAGLKVAGEPAPTKSNDYGLVPIRALTSRHRRRIAEHILALPEHDRYLRFGYMATDEQINKYVDGLNFKRDEIYGIFNRRLQLIAMAHLALASDPKNPNCAEFGVSVSADARGKGLGTALFERAVLHARAENIDMIFIHALSENDAMLKIARKAGAHVENYGGEVEAHLRLPEQDLGDRIETAVRDAVEDGIGIVDFRLKLRALQFWEFLAALQVIRKDVLASRTDSNE